MTADRPRTGVSRGTRITIAIGILAMVVFGAFGAVKSCASDMPSGTTEEDQIQRPKLQPPRSY